MLQLILLQAEAAEAGAQGVTYGMIPFIVIALVCLITYLIVLVVKKTGKCSVPKGLIWKLCVGYVLGWILSFGILIWRWHENQDNMRIKLTSTHWSWSGNTLDDDGDLIEYNLAINGIYTNNLIYSETGATGKCLGFVDSNGERCLYIDPGVNDEIRLDEINPLNIMRCKIMHYTSFVGDSFNTQIELLDLLNKECILSFDPGMLYVQKGFDELRPILERTDILLINESELRLLCNNNEASLKELAISLLDFGVETVVVKQGSKGVFAMDNSQDCFVESYPCDVVDTTAAGDSFNSGFLYSFLKGFDLEKSCRIGNWVASKAIEGFGMDKFPTLKDLEEFF